VAQHDDLKLPLTPTADKHAKENAQEPVEQRHQHETQFERAPPRPPEDPSPAESTFFTPQARRRRWRLGLIWDSRCLKDKQKPPIYGGFRSG
jgi:hypothetical protein